MYSAAEIVVLVDRLGRDAARGESADGVDELGPAGVVERDVQQQPVAAGGLLERVVDRSAGVVGELLEPAEQPDADALRPELGGLAPDRMLEEREQAARPRRPSGPSSRG